MTEVVEGDAPNVLATLVSSVSELPPDWLDRIPVAGEIVVCAPTPEQFRIVIEALVHEDDPRPVTCLIGNAVKTEFSERRQDWSLTGRTADLHRDGVLHFRLAPNLPVCVPTVIGGDRFGVLRRIDGEARGVLLPLDDEFEAQATTLVDSGRSWVPGAAGVEELAEELATVSDSGMETSLTDTVERLRARSGEGVDAATLVTLVAAAHEANWSQVRQVVADAGLCSKNTLRNRQQKQLEEIVETERIISDRPGHPDRRITFTEDAMSILAKQGDMIEKGGPLPDSMTERACF
jgi:hypothetical protein